MVAWSGWLVKVAKQWLVVDMDLTPSSPNQGLLLQRSTSSSPVSFPPSSLLVHSETLLCAASEDEESGGAGTGNGMKDNQVEERRPNSKATALGSSSPSYLWVGYRHPHSAGVVNVMVVQVTEVEW